MLVRFLRRRYDIQLNNIRPNDTLHNACDIFTFMTLGTMMFSIILVRFVRRRYDIQLNDIRHNDTQRNECEICKMVL